MSSIQGLTMREVKELQYRYGKNEISTNKKGMLLEKIKHILDEPIYLLLTCSSVIYFLLGEAVDGAIMIAFVLFVIGIDVLQDARTGNTLKKLKDLSTPKIKVIREETEMLIPSVDLVPGDVMLIHEGVKLPADGLLILCSGLCIDESILTGESDCVWKTVVQENNNPDGEYFRKDYCYTGTLVTLGNGIVIVDKIGNETEYGKIADKIIKVPSEATVLQKQMKKLAKQCTYIAAILFVMVSIVTFFNLSEYPLQKRWIESILAGVVLALSMVPGEFPVIQSVFLSMGALRLAKKHALIRRLPAVETLGAVSVLCVDKTGTITQNSMMVQELWSFDGRDELLCRTMALACKIETYDPMESAMLEYCVSATSIEDRRKLELVKEYAFTNELKAMGLIWRYESKRMIAVKGCAETILSLCRFSSQQGNIINEKLSELSKKGLRVIAVADLNLQALEAFPETLLDCKLHFRGFIGLLDPPRDHIIEDIHACHQAGIRVIMITGDHGITAASIACSAGITDSNEVITGEVIEQLSEDELRQRVKEVNIFARVLPLHKMRIVKALKDCGEIVAMIGDGVNDSPALKIADIGIAMGKHGSEVSREAADLILLDDNFSTILDSIQDGRRIYQNIIKSVGYIFAIHFPIAMVSFAAPLLGIAPEALLLLPLHIVLLELVMDPTCSVALERQPAERNIMQLPPRKAHKKLLSLSLLAKSITQGMAIFCGSFLLYYYLLINSYPAEIARTAGFSVMVLSNIFLVLVNCSDYDYIYQTIFKIRKDFGIWLVALFTVIGLVVMIYTPLSDFLKLSPLSCSMFLCVIGFSAISVLWYDIIKLFKRKKHYS